MKTVFTNDMVAHVWAAQTQHHGQNGKGTFRFQGASLYSYRVEIARIVAPSAKTKAVLLNDRSYSVTTSAHQSRARRAVSHLPRFSVPTALWEKPKEAHLAILANAVELLNKASRARVSGPYYLDMARARVEEANNFARLFKLRAPNAVLDDDLVAAVRRREDAVKRQERRDAREAAARQLRIYRERAEAYLAGTGEVWWRPNPNADAAFHQLPAEMQKLLLDEMAKRSAKAAADWRAGGLYDGTLLRDGPARLRIADKVVQTSMGAEVPVKDAKRLFPKIVAQRKLGQALDMYSATRPFPIGNFRLDKIEADGSIVVGCHNIPWSEIELIARELGLETA
jgi:hypothetical protein